MGRPYSTDLRGRFVAALDEGMSASAAGRWMRISRNIGSLGRHMARRRARGGAADGWGQAL